MYGNKYVGFSNLESDSIKKIVKEEIEKEKERLYSKVRDCTTVNQIIKTIKEW